MSNGISELWYPYGMGYEILEHTADLKLRVTAATLDELFGEAVRGMGEVLHTRARGTQTRRTIALGALDPTTLLIDFLNEVLALAYTQREVYTAVEFKRFSETELEAELCGVSVPEFQEDIKAVTYHGADVQQQSDGSWSVTLIFDI